MSSEVAVQCRVEGHGVDARHVVSVWLDAELATIGQALARYPGEPDWRVVAAGTTTRKEYLSPHRCISSDWRRG